MSVGASRRRDGIVEAQHHPVHAAWPRETRRRCCSLDAENDATNQHERFARARDFGRRSAHETAREHTGLRNQLLQRCDPLAQLDRDWFRENPLLRCAAGHGDVDTRTIGVAGVSRCDLGRGRGRTRLVIVTTVATRVRRFQLHTDATISLDAQHEAPRREGPGHEGDREAEPRGHAVEVRGHRGEEITLFGETEGTLEFWAPRRRCATSAPDPGTDIPRYGYASRSSCVGGLSRSTSAPSI